MPEFWEEAFKNKQEMWGSEPAKSAVLAKDYFLERKIKNVLIPGIGYGRNAKTFIENDINFTGIEISQTAIDLAKNHFGGKIKIHHGSVTDMTFSDEKYDGIFCYALIHLLDKVERAKLIEDCFRQLEVNGYMIFTAITKEAQTYGQGKLISKDRFEMFGGVNMFFYDIETINEEFVSFGLVETVKVIENYPSHFITCRKY